MRNRQHSITTERSEGLAVLSALYPLQGVSIQTKAVQPSHPLGGRVGQFERNQGYPVILSQLWGDPP